MVSDRRTPTILNACENLDETPITLYNLNCTLCLSVFCYCRWIFVKTATSITSRHKLLVLNGYLWILINTCGCIFELQTETFIQHLLQARGSPLWEARDSATKLSDGLKSGRGQKVNCPNQMSITGDARIGSLLQQRRGERKNRARERALSVKPLSRCGTKPALCTC